MKQIANSQEQSLHDYNITLQLKKKKKNLCGPSKHWTSSQWCIFIWLCIFKYNTC